MANKYFWLKLKEDFFQQEAIEWLEEQKNGKEYSLFYLKLCLKSLQNGGTLVRQIGTKTIPYTAKKLGEVTSTSPAIAEQAIELLKDIGLVVEQDNGVLFIPGLTDMVGSESSNANALRQKRYRDKHRSYDSVTQSVTNSNAQCNASNSNSNTSSVTNSNVDIRDKRLEIRDRENNNSLSFSLSCHGVTQNVTQLYEQKIGLLNARIAEQLADLLEQYGEERVVNGIQIAHERRAKTISYVAKCVENPIPEQKKAEYVDPFKAVFGDGGVSNGSN